MEEICSMSQCLYTCLPHVKFLVSPMYWTWMMGLSCSSATNLNGQCFRSFWTIWSWNLRPISRFASNTVFWGFVVICAFAASPISRWVSVKATTEGVVRFPISLGIISTLSSLHTPTQEYLRMTIKDSWHFQATLFGEKNQFWNFQKTGLFFSFPFSILFLLMLTRSIKPFASRLCGIRTFYGKIIPDHKLKYELIIYTRQ